MRLEKIKLAGFKSFVDPTTIPLPGNLVGVVGPNGCGKSNIIDAVRWVMGESSAKHLRGDTMADVIFNGSSTRKPVGVASVELVFDNTDSPAPGEYAAYQKIAIKRSVGRDGQSVYQLNGTRCRRKDITDLFLGTGLGARSYAIIEQGTISRLIEAKPDELRELIEEAAGISRYKERRHETEIRMRHTEENLARLEDLRGELKKQVDNLQRQVRKAERYIALRDEERAGKASLLRLRWRRHQASRAGRIAELEALGLDLRNAVSAARECDERLSDARERHEEQQAAMHEAQAQFYEVGAEVGRLEDLIRRAERSREETLSDLERLEADRARATAELDQDRSRLDGIHAELAECADALDEAVEAERTAATRRDAAESARKAAQTELDAVRSAALRLDGEADVLRARGRQIEEQSRHFEQRRERLEAERRELQTNLRQQEIEDLTREVEQCEAEAGGLATRIEHAAERQRAAQLRLHDDRHALDAVRAELHTTGGRLSSLELLQQHAMGKDRAGLSPWLEQMALRDAPRLAECLDVSAGWEDAVERVLGVHLEALCVSDAAPYLGHLHEIAEAESVAFQEMRPAGRNGAAPEVLPRLVDQIQSPWDLHPVLGSVFCAPDLTVAREVSGRIASHESVVTPSGERVGPGWVMIRRPDDGKAGVLRRERDLRETKDLLQSLGERSRILESSIEDHARELSDADAERKALETAARELDRRILGLKNALHELRARSEQAQRRLEQVDRELAEVDALGTELDESRLENIEASRSVELRIGATAEHVQALAARQTEAEHEFDEAAAALYEAQSVLRREQGRHDTLQSSEQLTIAHLERARTHCDEAAARLETLRGRFDQDRPLDEERERLDACRAERQVLEQRLAEMRRGIAEIDRRIRALGDERGGAEQRIDSLKERIEKARIELEGDQVRLQTLEEQFEPLGLTPTESGEVPDADERSEAELQQDLQRLADDLARLGPVNLMALEEYNEARERLEQLDGQYADLSESLATLRQAIDKIDRECRALFRETYDRINGGFQRMFPKLFGGGSASLDLTEREVLDAGVTVMARPPGKRNSSIHLLSGGEKALTAVALVFAIFELNPAPFCLLDEVDAPLDDANVGRFCGLVKEMSERVQFLFISHNKATMEIAQYLAGVTMKEPGVSRIVAVDLGEAVEMITA